MLLGLLPPSLFLSSGSLPPPLSWPLALAPAFSSPLPFPLPLPPALPLSLSPLESPRRRGSWRPSRRRWPCRFCPCRCRSRSRRRSRRWLRLRRCCRSCPRCRRWRCRRSCLRRRCPRCRRFRRCRCRRCRSAAVPVLVVAAAVFDRVVVASAVAGPSASSLPPSAPALASSVPTLPPPLAWSFAAVSVSVPLPPPLPAGFSFAAESRCHRRSRYRFRSIALVGFATSGRRVRTLLRSCTGAAVHSGLGGRARRGNVLSGTLRRARGKLRRPSPFREPRYRRCTEVLPAAAGAARRASRLRLD